jgi:hypothetical protein
MSVSYTGNGEAVVARRPMGALAMLRGFLAGEKQTRRARGITEAPSRTRVLPDHGHRHGCAPDA